MARSAARSWRNTSPTGSSRMTVDSGRRTDSMAATTGSTRITIPAPPPYGVSSTDLWRPSPKSRRSWMRTVARPCSWMRPGMLCDSGPSIMAGKSVRTSISRVMATAPADPRPRTRRRYRHPTTPRSEASLAAGRRFRDVRLGALGRSGSARRSFGSCRSSASASTTISPRRGAKIRMKARTAGTSNVPYAPPPTM